MGWAILEKWEKRKVVNIPGGRGKKEHCWEVPKKKKSTIEPTFGRTRNVPHKGYANAS